MPGYSQTETDSCLRCSEGHLLFLLGIQVSDQRVSLVDQYDQLIQQQLLSSLLGLRLLPICNDSRGTNSVRAGDTEDKLFWLLFWNLWDFYYLVLELVTSWDRWRFLQRLWSSWRRNFSNDTAYGVWFKDYRASTWQFGSSAANLLDCRDGHRTSCTYWVCRYDVYTYSGQVVCVCVCTVKLCWPEQTHLTDCHVNLQRHDAHRDMWGNTFPQGHAARFKTSIVILKTQTTFKKKDSDWTVEPGVLQEML